MTRRIAKADAMKEFIDTIATANSIREQDIADAELTWAQTVWPAWAAHVATLANAKARSTWKSWPAPTTPTTPKSACWNWRMEF